MRDLEGYRVCTLLFSVLELEIGLGLQISRILDFGIFSSLQHKITLCILCRKMIL